jgi:hypothetical protein
MGTCVGSRACRHRRASVAAVYKQPGLASVALSQPLPILATSQFETSEAVTTFVSGISCFDASNS